jgi:hypothetical protein
MIQFKEKAKAAEGLATSRTYVDKLVKITLSQVMEDRGIVKISQVGHIFAFFVFGGVDLSNKVFLEILGLFFRSSRVRVCGSSRKDFFDFVFIQ